MWAMAAQTIIYRTEMTVSILHLMIFTAWLAMEILGVTLILAGASTGGWSVLGVFTSIAVIPVLVTLVVNIYKTQGMGVDPNLPKLVAVPASAKPVIVPADSSAKAFVMNLEEAGAV
jgi:hypothetical protein